ncbi:MAG: hypothetical protein JWM25_627 [Thermoleophilia bacterium]|nr:hypothetical protein [Thermoleophilia bacterium]MCZ4496044.1 hypothetical protein [Thermoleophilia bacterium]
MTFARAASAPALSARSRALLLLTSLLVAFGILTSMPTSARAAAATLHGAPTFTPAASYPRSVPTDLQVHVDTDEGATFKIAASGALLATQVAGCSTGTVSCNVASGGKITIADDGDTATNGPVQVTIRLLVTPASTVPIVSEEGSPMGTMPRELEITLTPLAPTAGSTHTATAIVLVASNPAFQAELSIATLAPIDGGTVQRGGTVPYRARITRSGNMGQQVDATISLVPGTAISGTAPAGTSRVVFMPNVTTVTVELPVVVSSTATTGLHGWRLRAAWGADMEVGALRTFTVPAPPAPPVTPAKPKPPVKAAVAPRPVALVTPLPARPDTRAPSITMQLVIKGAVLVRRLNATLFILGERCPTNEKACVLRTSLTWKTRPGGPTVRIGAATLYLKAGAVGTTQVKLTPLGRKLLAKRGALRTVLTVQLTDKAGNTSSLRRAVVLKYRPRR